MPHYLNQFENKYPELNELLALKEGFIRLVLGDKQLPPRKILKHPRPVRCLLIVIRSELRNHVVVWLFILGMAEGFRYLLNPLGIPNYF